MLTDSLAYHAWGYLGPAVLLRLRDGHVVATLRGDRAAALDGERFLLALEGYDVFDTWLHDRDGRVVQQWRSCGHLVPDPDGSVRVIEQDRTSPTRSRVVRLHLDGTIEHGPSLDDGLASRPVVRADGTLVFVDRGRLVAVARALVRTVVAELQPVAPDDAWRFHAHLAEAEDRVHVALCERLPEALQPSMPGRTAGDMKWRTHLSTFRRTS